MRKTFLSLLCLVMGCCALAGCSDNSQPFEEKSYTPDTQVREIQLDVEDRSIEVVLSPDNQVHIQYFENSKEYYQISVSDENVLTMTSASDKAWTDYIGVKPAAEDRRIRLEIPDGLLENVTLSTTILRVQIDTINFLWLSFFNLRKHHNICTFSFFPAHPHGIGYRFSTCNSRLSSRVLSY